jgi:16S rRNA C967 or C1407 C5-methylase (RsmB/RsmF family)/NOL1/NOP2/fmu family ribosome biogenesis protein
MNLPEAFTTRMKQKLGAGFPDFLDALQTTPPVSIRLNASKLSVSDPPEADFASRNDHLPTVPWASHAFYLPERPVFTLDPVWHAGGYYVQEASSMLLEQAILQTVDISQPIRALDLCAAPGGKSTHLLNLLPPDSLVLANEVIRGRARILRENLTKWGAPQAVISQNDPRDFQKLPGFFDLIIVDAPCSGEGLFRRDAAAVNEWSPANLERCCERQQRIVMDVWEALKPGGILIYSTCTYHPGENENNVRWILEQTNGECLPLAIETDWGFQTIQVDSVWAYQALPHEVKGEGFFLSVIRKKGALASVLPKVRKPKLEKASHKETASLASWLRQGDWEILKLQDRFLAFPALQTQALLGLSERLNLMFAGVKLGEQKKKGTVPAPDLATSQLLHPEAFPRHNLDWGAAMAYLKREPIATDLPDGWGLICYQELSLGFVKKIGKRINNYFPQDWRIRMSVPTEQGWTLL